MIQMWTGARYTSSWELLAIMASFFLTILLYSIKIKLSYMKIFLFILLGLYAFTFLSMYVLGSATEYDLD